MLDNYEYLNKAYWTDGKSIKEIADALGTYPTKVIRAMSKLGIRRRNKSEAQKKALASGNHPHPTKGKHHSEESRKKISEEKAKDWAKKTPEELEAISERNKQQWNNLSDAKKGEIRSAAAKAIRLSSDIGSKMERCVAQGLIEAGYTVDFHKDQFFEARKLQLDIFLPEMSVAIEIDGPSHFLPIWGEAALQKSIQADTEKNALLITNKITIIRVKHLHKKISQKLERDILKAIIDELKQLKASNKKAQIITIDI